MAVHGIFQADVEAGQNQTCRLRAVNRAELRRGGHDLFIDREAFEIAGFAQRAHARLHELAETGTEVGREIECAERVNAPAAAFLRRGARRRQHPAKVLRHFGHAGPGAPQQREIEVAQTANRAGGNLRAADFKREIVAMAAQRRDRAREIFGADVELRVAAEREGARQFGAAGVGRRFFGRFFGGRRCCRRRIAGVFAFDAAGRHDLAVQGAGAVRAAENQFAALDHADAARDARQTGFDGQKRRLQAKAPVFQRDFAADARVFDGAGYVERAGKLVGGGAGQRRNESGGERAQIVARQRQMHFKRRFGRRAGLLPVPRDFAGRRRRLKRTFGDRQVRPVNLQKAVADVEARNTQRIERVAVVRNVFGSHGAGDARVFELAADIESELRQLAAQERRAVRVAQCGHPRRELRQIGVDDARFERDFAAGHDACAFGHAQNGVFDFLRRFARLRLLFFGFEAQRRRVNRHRFAVVVESGVHFGQRPVGAQRAARVGVAQRQRLDGQRGPFPAPAERRLHRHGAVEARRQLRHAAHDLVEHGNSCGAQFQGALRFAQGVQKEREALVFHADGGVEIRRIGVRRQIARQAPDGLRGRLLVHRRKVAHQFKLPRLEQAFLQRQIGGQRAQRQASPAQIGGAHFDVAGLRAERHFAVRRTQRAAQRNIGGQGAAHRQRAKREFGLSGRRRGFAFQVGQVVGGAQQARGAKPVGD